MKQFLQTLFFFLLVTQISFAQKYNENPVLKSDQNDALLSYTFEDFEGAGFPPAGWALDFGGLQYWTRYIGASGYGVGSASAKFDIWYAPNGTIQSLVLSSMGVSVAGDSIRFDHAYASYLGEVDRLIIETSTNGGTTYTTLISLDGGVSGPLVTAPPQTTIFVPTMSQWATKSYALPIGTNRLRFKAISAYGNNLYLDNCTISKQSSIDIAARSIDILNPTLTLPQVPKATVKNHGTTTQTFSVTMLISPDGYISTRTVTALAGNATSQVSFDEWTPTLGLHNVTFYITLASDLDHTNDTLQLAIQVNQAQALTNMNAVFRDGQVFITWDNSTNTNIVYTVYKSFNPIQYGYQLAFAQNLGDVRDNSGKNKRFTYTLGTPTNLRIDSASVPLENSKGLFVATSNSAGSFYYAVTPSFNNLEDTAIVPGSNSLVSPVTENIMMPRPVWQMSRVVGGRIFDIYVQFATKVTSPIYPQMTNAGSFPFHFAIVKSGSVAPHPITFCMHGRNSNFLDESISKGIGEPNSWVITIDDWIPNDLANTHYYGYHENLDIQSIQNQIPDSGVIYNYTSARVAFTIDWAIRNLPVDSTRVYMSGISMGAFGSLINGFVLPTKIAAMFVIVPRFDGSWTGYTLWGSPETNLLTNEGLRRNDRLNASYLARLHRSTYLPILYTFCGKTDVAVGWDEKPPFYDSLNIYRLGGFHFWSMGDHGSAQLQYSPWGSSFPNFAFFTRYRTNLSYPAFSNCSINGNPGNGTPSNGDPTGTINGHLDWNDDIVDTTNRWEITLRVKDLLTTTGTRVAPDSCVTDVTLRRLQAFSVPAGETVQWQNENNNIVIQQGSFVSNGEPITIPAVKMFKTSSRLKVSFGMVSVSEQLSAPSQFQLQQNFPNPFNPSTVISWQSPVRSQVTLKVYDALGNEIATLVNEEKEAGIYEVEFDAEKFSSGVYFYKLTAGNFISTRKMLLLK